MCARTLYTALQDGSVKRVFDVSVSIAGLALLAPLLAMIALIVRSCSTGPALYRSTRIGRAGEPFQLLKFRTMRVGADRIGGSSTPDDDPRITRVGAFLRRYKLDELPQLWNVLVGEMSLVGPRPQVPWAVKRYNDQERIVLTVRPGITDPASLRFANEGDILRGHPNPDEAYFELIHPEKMRLSVHYVKTQSLGGDLRILAATLGVALRGPSAASHAARRRPSRS
jgi:lipopolysaccharide/colanic/teichoic acid biosynthesis glycosyltransferase